MKKLLLFAMLSGAVLADDPASGHKHGNAVEKIQDGEILGHGQYLAGGLWGWKGPETAPHHRCILNAHCQVPQRPTNPARGLS